MSTLDSFLFYSDDGSCETVKSSTSCREKAGWSILSTAVGSSCTWDSNSQSCSYNPPPWACTTVLVHVIFSAVTAASFYSILSLLVSWLKRYEDIGWKVSSLDDKLDDFGDTHAHNDDYKFAAIHPTIDPTADELIHSSRPITRYFIAARLKRIQGLSDFILPARECSAILDAHTAEKDKFELKSNRYGKLVLDYLDNKISSGYFQAFRATVVKYKLQRCINSSRTIADRIDAHCNDLPSPYEKDSHLMKFFLVDLLNGHAKFIAAKYMGISTNGENRLKQLTNWGLYADLVAVVLIILSLLVLMLVCQSFIGTRSITLWLTVTLVAFFEDFCIVQPVCILLNALEVDSNSRDEFARIWRTARLRYRYILNRQQGFMTYANCVIQHLNPGCRAARMKPELPVSRFLISVNDFDFPMLCKNEKWKHPKASHSSHTTQIIYYEIASFTRKVLQSVFYLPKLFRTFFFYCLSIIAVNLVAMAVYLLGSNNLAGAIVTAIFILCVGLYLWPTATSRTLKESVEQQRRRFIATLRKSLGYISLEETFSNEQRTARRKQDNATSLQSQSSAKVPLSESMKSVSDTPDDNGSLTRTLNELDTIIRKSSRMSSNSLYQFDQSRLSLDLTPARILGSNEGRSFGRSTEDNPFRPGTASSFSFDTSFGDFSKEESVEEKEELPNFIARNDLSSRFRSQPTSVVQTANSTNDLKFSVLESLISSRDFSVSGRLLEESPTKPLRSVRQIPVVQAQNRTMDSPTIPTIDSLSVFSSPSTPVVKASSSIQSFEGSESPSKVQPRLRQTTVVQVQRRQVDSSVPAQSMSAVTSINTQSLLIPEKPFVPVSLNDYSPVVASSAVPRSAIITNSEDELVAITSQRNARGSTRKGPSSVRPTSKRNNAASDFDSVSTLDLSMMKSSHAIPSTIESYLRQTESNPRVLAQDEGIFHEGDFTTLSEGRNSEINMTWSSPTRAHTAESKSPPSRLYQPLWVESLDDGSISRTDTSPSRDGYVNTSRAQFQSKRSIESAKLQPSTHDLSDENGLRSAAMRAKRRSHQIQGNTSRPLEYRSSSQRLFQPSQLSNSSDSLPIDRSSSVSSYDAGLSSRPDPRRDERSSHMSRNDSREGEGGRKRVPEDSNRHGSERNNNNNINHHRPHSRGASRNDSRRAHRGRDANIDTSTSDDRVPGPGSRSERREK